MSLFSDTSPISSRGRVDLEIDRVKRIDSARLKTDRLDRSTNHLTDNDKQNSRGLQENTDKQTQYKSEKVDNLKYSKKKLPWFSCLLQHSVRK